MLDDGSGRFSKLRGNFKSWWEERKLRSNVSSLRRHFEKTFAEGVKQTGETEADFDFIRRLGSGAYGVVNLVMSRKTSQLGALKELDRYRANRKYLNSEIKLMSSIMHPFIVTMKGHFTVSDSLYMEMPYYAGGDLFSFIHDHGKCSYELSRFYGAQLVMAIDFLHSLGVVHRDLKTKNVMIDSDGYLKIVDFGISKKSDGCRMRTICGTLEYTAPEMYADTLFGYGKSVDWWAFGVIMYNIIIGRTPHPKNITQMDIMRGIINYPLDMDHGSKEFLQAILEVRVSKRLGCGSAGAHKIMRHPWFQRVDWTDLFFKKVAAPWVPVLKTEPSSQESATNTNCNANVSCVAIFEFSDF